jgi:hypothetical protein
MVESLETFKNNNSSSRVTNKQVYDLLYELKTEVKVMSEKLDNEIKKIEDHEQRIRKIEETIWRSAWVTSLVTALITACATAVVVAMSTGKL